MYKVLLYTSKMQEDKLYIYLKYIYNFKSNKQFDIALVLVLLYCMHARGTSVACRQMEEGLEGTGGDSWSPMLIPGMPPSKQYFEFRDVLQLAQQPLCLWAT